MEALNDTDIPENVRVNLSPRFTAPTLVLGSLTVNPDGRLTSKSAESMLASPMFSIKT